MHFHLDNSRMSAHINNNTFTEAGITISSKSTYSHQPVFLENNTFQGNKADPILEVQNTTNILIAANMFQNSQLSFRHIVDNNSNSGVLIHNSHKCMIVYLKMFHFFPFLNLKISHSLLTTLQ